MRLLRNTIFLLVTLFLAYPVAHAEVAAGSWIVHPSFVPPGQKIAETDDLIYFLMGGSLFSINKKTDEAISYVYGNPLNDWNITDLYINHERGAAVVVYDNGNIDIIDKKGSIINVNDIKNASDVDDRSIRGIAFDDKTAFVATGFGLVSIDVTTGRIKDSGKYGFALQSVGLHGDKLFIVAEGKLYSADKNARINRTENFVCEGDIRFIDEILPIKNNLLVTRTGNLLCFGETQNGNYQEYHSEYILDKPLVRGSEAIYCITADNRLMRIDTDGNRTILQQMPVMGNDEAIGGEVLENGYWSLDRNGMVYNVYENGKWVEQTERFLPQGVVAAKSIDFIIPGKVDGNIYFGNLGATLYRNGATDALDVMQQMAQLKDGRFVDRSATDVKGEFWNVLGQQEIHGPYLITPERFDEDPDNESVYFIGTGNDGLYKIENRRFAGRYAGGNSPISTPWGYRVFEVSIDMGGNLWIGYDGTGKETGVAVLPHDKLILSPDQVDVSDWINIDVKDMPVDRDMRIFHCKLSPVTLIFNWNGEDGLIIYNNGGTPSVFSDDKINLINRLIDQDGLVFTPERFTSVAEDRQGHLWIGCEGGMIEITDPVSANDSQLNVRRIKIGHDDGTGLADYFCVSDRILDIDIDGADRKWVTTEESGIFLLNKEANTILLNFSTDNSPLPSNSVKAVYADKTGNSVFFGTQSGLLEYGSDASQPKPDYSAIKVYPNPVTPQTQVNFVTISGLVDGTEVKISDSSGAFVWHGYAEGGMARWNLENSSGRHVSSGIYYVFLSSENKGSAAAKIMIIN